MGTVDQRIVIPYKPRTHQRELHALADRFRFGTIVCHRRFGKTVFAVNHLDKGAMTCSRERPRFAHIFPTYRQGKAVAWDYAKHYPHDIPGIEINETELRIDFPNGGQYRIFGADNPDSLRGLYFDGVIFDEYGLQPSNIFTEVVRPLLSDRQGWALFMGTPNGKNQFYDAKMLAQADTTGTWFYAEYKASETDIIPAAELTAARAVMTEDEYQQEYECSFEASVKGAIFARELAAARADGRVTRVPYDPALPVDTDWDLGVGDATAIWFSQTLYSGEIRLIDYYETSGEGLAHYKKVLQDKPYTYGTHWAPHDIEVRELGSGRSRREAAMQMGLHFQVCPKVEKLEDGIHAARMLFPKCWFDHERCRHGMDALQSYRWDYNTRLDEFKHLPVHDWASHGADAFKGLAFRHYTPRRHPEREAAAAVRRAQIDHDPYRWNRNPPRRGGY